MSLSRPVAASLTWVQPRALQRPVIQAACPTEGGFPGAASPRLVRPPHPTWALGVRLRQAPCTVSRVPGGKDAGLMVLEHLAGRLSGRVTVGRARCSLASAAPCGRLGAAPFPQPVGQRAGGRWALLARLRARADGIRVHALSSLFPGRFCPLSHPRGPSCGPGRVGAFFLAVWCSPRGGTSPSSPLLCSGTSGFWGFKRDLWGGGDVPVRVSGSVVLPFCGILSGYKTPTTSLPGR